MAITMFDSVTASSLPSGSGYAYAGYVDGAYADYNAIKARFPHSNVLAITVFGSMNADCIDIENTDATVEQGAEWLIKKLNAGYKRPCAYASASIMGSVINTLENLHSTSLSLVRVWTAHYGEGEHICGPSTCNYLSTSADGTQWTDVSSGLSLDQSILQDNFFSSTPPPPAPSVPSWEVKMMNTLPTKKQGDKDTSEPWFIRRIQGLCLAMLPGNKLAIDGDFGPATATAVKTVQKSHGVATDGVVGPVTWSVLVTGAQ